MWKWNVTIKKITHDIHNAWVRIFVSKITCTTLVGIFTAKIAN